MSSPNKFFMWFNQLIKQEPRRSFLRQSIRFLAGIGAIGALTPFWASWKPSDKAALANRSVSVDVSHLQPGQQMIVEWRGKPISILRRTPAMLEQLNDTHELRDPNSEHSNQPKNAQNQFRAIEPEYAVLVGLCTHLGCIPKLQAQGQGIQPDGAASFYCPCHGSRFDLAGRVYKDVPAMQNLEVPPYHFLQNHTLVIGEC